MGRVDPQTLVPMETQQETERRVQNGASSRGQNPLGLDMWLWGPSHGYFKVTNLSLSRIWFMLLKGNERTVSGTEVILSLCSSVRRAKITHWEMKACHPAVFSKLTSAYGFDFDRLCPETPHIEFQRLISFCLMYSPSPGISLYLIVFLEPIHFRCKIV